MRLDVYLVESGMVSGRNKAKELIVSGKILLNNKLVLKPSEKVSENDKIQLTDNPFVYVSRGGLKLEKAIREFKIQIKGKVCVDIGASTGGFTDCMLQNEAKKVYAIDVGSQQLAEKLRKDNRVVVLENTNIRHFETDIIQEEIEFISIDVSFISLKLVLPVARKLLKDNGQLVCLIKPQFEAGIENVGKNGVVVNPKIHEKVIREIVLFSREIGFCATKLEFSPVKGPKGNIEYLLLLGSEAADIADIEVGNVVQTAHNDLK